MFMIEDLDKDIPTYIVTRDKDYVMIEEKQCYYQIINNKIYVEKN